MGDAVTTIRLPVSVKNSLNELKNFSGETYSDVISRLINCAEEDPLNENEINQIENSLNDLKNGKIISLKQAKKKRGF